MSYAIRFEGVTKRYIRGASRYRTIRQDIAEGFRTAGQRMRGHPPGPRGRLALEDVSFAAHLDPDSFLVDEALAVGDAVFQAKCVEHMSKLLAEGRTLMFVSHDLSAVESLCRRGVFVLDGRIRSEGAIGDVIRDYL